MREIARALLILLAAQPFGCAAKGAGGTRAGAPPPAPPSAPPVTTAPPAPTPEAAPPGTGLTEARVDELFRALQAGKFEEATGHFDARMKAGLPPAQIEATWRGLEGQVGALRSFETVERKEKDGFVVHEVALGFERARFGAIVAVSPTSGEIAGLFLQPTPPATSTSTEISQTDLPPGARTEEVVVGAPPWQLGGTLTLPEGKGPFAGAILVGGSGPHDRDGTVGATKPLRDLAAALAARGIATLRYDKRTLAHREKLSAAPTITLDEEVIDDAAAAVALLRRRPEIAKKRIFVVGHSLGAFAAPFIAKRAAPVAGLVLLAPPGRPLPRMVVDQLQAIGAKPEVVAEARTLADALLAGKLPPTATFLGAPVSYWQDLLRRDPVAATRALGLPVLALRGARDYQVRAEDLGVWEAGLGGRPGVKIETLPALNHLFVAGEGPPGPAEYAQPGRVDELVGERVAAFVRGAAAPKD
jgi:hypothetical protein